MKVFVHRVAASMQNILQEDGRKLSSAVQKIETFQLLLSSEGEKTGNSGSYNYIKRDPV